MPATPLDVTQTQNVNTAVDVPNIVNSLDTNTGPQASPQAFGVNLAGLTQGLDESFQSLHQSGREAMGFQERADGLAREASNKASAEAERQQNAQGELWAVQQHVALNEQTSKTLEAARVAGTPMDPDAFNATFSTNVDKVADNAPSPQAAMAFRRGAAEMGGEFFDQNLRVQAGQAQQNRLSQARDSLSAIQQQVRSGTMSPDDGAAAVLAVGGTAAVATGNHPAVSGMTQQAMSGVVTGAITNVAQQQGPGAAAAALRGGFGGNYITPTDRETAATNLDNSQTINMATRVSVAQQKVDSLAAQKAAGTFVSPQDQFAAAKELSDAKTATPVPTAQPDLTDFLQSRMDHYSDLSSKVSGEAAQGQLGALQKIEAGDLSHLVDQRLALLPPAQQRDQVNEMVDRFGPESPLAQHAAGIAQKNIAMLTPGKTYNPVGYVKQNPAVATTLQNARAMYQDTSVDRGTAAGAMTTALATSFSAQQIAGVQPGQERIFEPAEAKQMATSMNDPATAGAMVAQLQNEYPGKLAGRAIGEVANSAGLTNGAVQTYLLNPSSQRLNAAANFKPEKVPPTDPNLQSINSAITSNSLYADYWKSQQSDLGSAQRQASMQEALPGMARYYQTQFGMSPSEAVNTAINDSIGHAFHVMPSGNGNTIGFPTTLVPDEQTGQSIINNFYEGANRLISKDGIADAGGAQDQGHLWQKAITDGHLAYDAKTETVALMYDNGKGVGVVKLGNGKPLMLDAAALRDAVIGQIPNPNYHAGPGVKAGPGRDSITGMLSDPETMLRNPERTIDNSPVLQVAPGSSAASKLQSGNSFSQQIQAPTAKAPQAAPDDIPTAQPEAASATGSARALPVNDENHGWGSGAESTHYAYPGDATPDSNSMNGKGAFENPLSPGAIALSPSLEQKTNAQPGDVFEMRDDQGNKKYGYFADRTSSKLKNDRIDFYDPHGSSDKGAPFNVASYRKIGGGKPGLTGRQLTASGESRIANLEASHGG